MLPKTSSSKCRWFAPHADFREVNPKDTEHNAANHAKPWLCCLVLTLKLFQHNVSPFMTAYVLIVLQHKDG